ncbi:hypothetical protein BDFB_011922, partial [Asbolus verrucosus]
YYWRDYNGVIPEDAFPGGQDAHGDDVYIGQIYVNYVGLCVGPIVPGKTEVEFYCWGYNNATAGIKILCTSHREYLQWLSTSSSSFHLDTINKHTVIGGYDQNAEIPHNYNIGRFNRVIGVVDAVTPETVYLYILEEGDQYRRIDNYEVLISMKDND